MSHFSTGALGLIAASLAFGGVQFGMASDGSLARAVRGDASLQQNVSSHVALAVNRAMKADREAMAPAQAAMVTLLFRLPALKETSVAVRLPTTEVSRLQPVKNEAAKASMRRKAPVACEPVVSVLTDVAKLLAPGRCIT